MAGARQSRNSKHRRLQSDRYSRRKVEVRNTLPIIAVVCDDTVAAPAYFRILKRLHIEHLMLNIVPARCRGASPNAIADQAIKEYKKLEKSGGDKNDINVVWAVLDLEHQAPRRKQAWDEKKRAEKVRGVKVALSDPCYEVWTLLHLVDTGEHFDNCGKVTDRVNRIWKEQFDQPFIPKTQADYSKIIDLRHNARKWAKKHRESNDPSWTEVYKVIEDIESIVQAASTKAK